MKIGIVYTTHPKYLTEEVERCVRNELGEEVEVLSFADASILEEVIREGRITPGAAARLVGLYMDAVKAGCCAVLNACSSVGEVADSMKKLSRMIGIPIVRIDKEMCRLAVTGEDEVHDLDAICHIPRLVAVMATVPSTMGPTTRLLRHWEEKEEGWIRVKEILVENAFGLEQEALTNRLCEAAAAAEGYDCIVLAQATMSLSEERIHLATGLPVYSSPRYGARALRKALSL